MSIVVFELSMPNNNAWNKKWSGEGRCYAVVKNLGKSKKAEAKAQKLAGSYYYNFGDGWCASVSVREVTKEQAAKLRRMSKGFCGYNWMIDSILMYGEIIVERRKTQ